NQKISKDTAANISYNDGNTEYHLACPTGSYRNIRLPTDMIQIDGDGVAVDLKQLSGKTDTVVVTGSPITLKNKNYVGIGVKPIQDANPNPVRSIEHFATTNGMCL